MYVPVYSQRRLIADASSGSGVCSCQVRGQTFHRGTLLFPPPAERPELSARLKKRPGDIATHVACTVTESGSFALEYGLVCNIRLCTNAIPELDSAKRNTHDCAPCKGRYLFIPAFRGRKRKVYASESPAAVVYLVPIMFNARNKLGVNTQTARDNTTRRKNSSRWK